jgi:hypothetical protein
MCGLFAFQSLYLLSFGIDQYLVEAGKGIIRFQMKPISRRQVALNKGKRSFALRTL